MPFSRLNGLRRQYGLMTVLLRWRTYKRVSSGQSFATQKERERALVRFVREAFKAYSRCYRSAAKRLGSQASTFFIRSADVHVADLVSER
jgi:hypothetical protein